MTVLEKATAFLPKISNSEIAQLVQMASQKTAVDFPGIEKTPNVCGGSACIIRTRIPVWSIVEYRLIGVGKEKLLRNFPTLRAQDLANAGHTTMPIKLKLTLKLLKTTPIKYVEIICQRKFST